MRLLSSQATPGFIAPSPLKAFSIVLSKLWGKEGDIERGSTLAWAVLVSQHLVFNYVSIIFVHLNSHRYIVAAYGYVERRGENNQLSSQMSQMRFLVFFKFYVYKLEGTLSNPVPGLHTVLPPPYPNLCLSPTLVHTECSALSGPQQSG